MSKKFERDEKLVVNTDCISLRYTRLTKGTEVIFSHYTANQGDYTCAVYLNEVDRGFTRGRVCLKPEWLSPIEEPEPDYHVYPDTPVGTELVVIQDTKNRTGRFIHKGTPVALEQSDYSTDGAYRWCRLPNGLTLWIDCDDLMLKGYTLNE